MVRKRGLGLSFVACAVWWSQACGESVRHVDESDEGGGGTSGFGATTGNGGSAGSSGVSTGGSGDCDGLYCRYGTIGLGPCPGENFTSCDRDVSGVDCVAAGRPCPRRGAGGTGGDGGTAGDTGGFGGEHQDCAACNDAGYVVFRDCPGEPFTFCDPDISIVECVSTGRCPYTGEGGAGGRGGEGGAR